MSATTITIPAYSGEGEGEWRVSAETSVGDFQDYIALQKTGAWLVFAGAEPSVLDAAGDDTLTVGVDYDIREIASPVWVVVVLTETLPVTLEYPPVLAHYMGPVVDGSGTGWEPYHAGSFVVEEY